MNIIEQHQLEQQKRFKLQQEQAVAIMDSFSEWSLDHVLSVLQMTVAAAIIEYSGQETEDGKFDWSIVKAIDSSMKFRENVDALIRMNHQNNEGSVIITE